MPEQDTSPWTAIDREFFCPSLVATGEDTMRLFGRSARGELLHREYRDGEWSPRESLGGPVGHDPASGRTTPVEYGLSAVHQEAGCQLFGYNPDGSLLWLANADAGNEFANLGAPAAAGIHGQPVPIGLAGPPAACTDGERIRVYAMGQDGHLLHHQYVDGEWGPFDTLGVPEMYIAGNQPRPVPVFQRLSACTAGHDRSAVFLTTRNGVLLLKWWDGKAWSEFASLGMGQARSAQYSAAVGAAPLTSPPAACSWGPGHLDVFVRSQGGTLLRRSWDGKDWGSFQSLPMPVSEDVSPDTPVTLLGGIAVCSRYAGRIDVLATGIDGQLYHLGIEDDN